MWLSRALLAAFWLAIPVAAATGVEDTPTSPPVFHGRGFMLEGSMLKQGSPDDVIRPAVVRLATQRQSRGAISSLRTR